MHTGQSVQRGAIPLVLAASAVLLAGCVTGPVIATTAITTGAVNVRAGPSTTFPILDSVPGGATLTVYGCLKGGSWCDASSGIARGWVSSQYLANLAKQQAAAFPQVPVFVSFGYWGNS